MGRKHKITTVLKPNIAFGGKRGFTLAELCVVLAIVVIVSTMIVSFSVSMNNFANSNKEEYDFLEDCATVKNELYKWIAENDVPSDDAEIATVDSIFASVNNGVDFNKASGTLMLGGKKIENLQMIKDIHLVLVGDDMIKCDIYKVDSDSIKSYVFALRTVD